MTALSLVAGNCGKVGEESVLKLGSNLNSCNGLLPRDLSKSWIRNGKNSIWWRNLGEFRIRRGRRSRLCVVARVRKGKKHDYPWPDDIDPNSSAPLAYLSSFKPLEEKPKVVTLGFEKPLVDLERKIIEVRNMAEETGLDFSDQINALENKYQLALKELYMHLTPIQRLSIARHPNRPTVLDHILNITEKWVELHGDRAGYDDPAIVTGIGSMDGKSYMFIGHQKGRNTKENIARNFAMPTPHGYRKALRMMKYADHHGIPIITFVDTPGAFADLKSEELGQGEAIAYNLRAMFGFKVPIITVVTGEGGSGGALAIACANKLFMLENAAFYVASPEACAAILWKSSQAAPKAAEKLRITAQEHCRLGIADGIIPEPLGGAHADPAWTSAQIKITITQAMEELTKMDKEELLHHRMRKFRSIGVRGFQEGLPIDPQRKRNMKLSDLNTTADIESDIESFKKKILEAKGPSDPITIQTINKIKEDLDKELMKAFISMGLQDRIESLNLEISRAPISSPDQPLNPVFKEKADKILFEFKQKLAQPGAYLGLKQKLQKLNMVHKLVEIKEKNEKLKAEINKRVPEDIKAKKELLKKAQERLRNGDPLDAGLAEEVDKVRKELEEVLKSANLEIVGVAKRSDETAPPGSRDEAVKVNNEIMKEIERAVNETGLKEKIGMLKEVVAEGLGSERVRELEAEIKEDIAAAVDVTKLKEKVENLRAEQELTVKAVSEGQGGADNGRF